MAGQGTREFAELNYTLSGLMVAQYLIRTNTYGPPASLADGQMFEIEFECDNDKLPAWGAYAALLSVAKGAKIKMGAGGVDADVLHSVGGMTNVTSGAAGSRRRKSRLLAGGAGLNYYGALASGPTDDGGLLVIGLQACKLNTFPKWTFDGKTNKFNMSETEGYAIPRTINNSFVLGTFEFWEDAADFVAPTNAAEFLAFFTEGGDV
jgi:hypothetical protein